MNSETLAGIRACIQDNQLVGISFLTEKLAEVVHPRVIAEGKDSLYVYGRTSSSAKLRRIEMVEFLTRLARDDKGLAVGGIRKSNGRQTSVSFSKMTRVLYSPAFERLLRQFG